MHGSTIEGMEYAPSVRVPSAMLGSMLPHPVRSGQPELISWPRQASRQDYDCIVDDDTQSYDTSMPSYDTIHQGRTTDC